MKLRQYWKISLVLTGIIIVLCAGIFILFSTPETIEEHVCTPLPAGFKASDLIGTWVGEYFESIDKLIIRADGTYKQIYSDNYMSFESDWQKWSIEYNPHGYARLHLAGMRRCDDLDICNNPGGGLPVGVVALNPCEPGNVTYTNEVILFVTGRKSEVPRGIVLRQAKLAGSDWSWGYQLQE